jgi:hypothetical protein
MAEFFYLGFIDCSGCRLSRITQILNGKIVEDKTWELFLAKYYGLI